MTTDAAPAGAELGGADPPRRRETKEQAAARMRRVRARQKALASQVAAAYPEVDVAWHTAPAAGLPAWTSAGEAQFLQAVYDGRGSLKYAAQACGLPFRAVVEALERDPEGPLATRVAWTQRLYREHVYEVFQDRVIADTKHPANIIFDLKSRDARYTPPEGKSGARVQIAIAVTDPTFTRPKPIAATVIP